ncbi:MAG: FKBP-type peptidyl-prolyl cis-trans isomerase [Pseudomonadota bacterium]|nr:FKBP-type peptidyl-prolyl cis-trans isomerase [Pseudomonadota bacterium]
MRKWLILVAVGMSAAVGADDTEIKTFGQKFSYALGYQLGSDLADQVLGKQLELDAELFARGIADVLSGRDPALDAQEMEAAFAEQRKKNPPAVSLAERNSKEGEAFRAANRLREGVVEMEHGLQYRVVKAGSGAMPTLKSKMAVHYRGRLIDGTEFDSSYKRGYPVVMTPSQIIPGFRMALLNMVEGDTWEVVIPPELAYGRSGAGQMIGPSQTLIFDIELLEIK